MADSFIRFLDRQPLPTITVAEYKRQREVLCKGSGCGFCDIGLPRTGEYVAVRDAVTLEQKYLKVTPAIRRILELQLEKKHEAQSTKV